MSTFYYANNEVLTPPWKSPETSKGIPIWAILGAVLGVIGLGLWLWLFYFPDQNVRKATVLVDLDIDGDGTSDAQASGVLIGPKGYILTNKHVAFPDGKQAKRIQVWYWPGSPKRQVMDAEIVKKAEGELGLDPDKIVNDWAVLQVKTTEPLPYVPISDQREFQEEEKVKVYGYPMGSDVATNQYGPSVKILQGIINRVDRNAQQAVLRLTHSAKTAPGMSGGAVTRWNGALIGLTTSGKVDVADPNENYALPVYLIKEQIKEFLP